MYPSSAKKLMRKEQLMLEDGSISQEQFDTQLRDKIGKKQLKQLTKKDLQVLAIYREMNAGQL